MYIISITATYVSHITNIQKYTVIVIVDVTIPSSFCKVVEKDVHQLSIRFQKMRERLEMPIRNGQLCQISHDYSGLLQNVTTGGNNAQG